jgi:cation transport protein ChaC
VIERLIHKHPELYKEDLWIFGYASLLWNPGFHHREVFPARIYGFHRALCVRSWVHRGTPQRPGLVFGLDIGGSCVGRGFRVARAQRNQVLDYLIERELATGVYRPQVTNVHMNGYQRKGLAFVVRRDHRQYVRGLSVEREAEIIRAGQGPSGANRDYVLNTVVELERLGIRDRRLSRLKLLLESSNGVGKRA